MENSTANREPCPLPTSRTRNKSCGPNACQRIRRLSIDADIFCHEPPEKLDALLAEVSRSRPFTGRADRLATELHSG